MHLDKYGLVGQIQTNGSIEGGDSVCWMGHWIYLSDKKFPYVQTFEKGFGGYVRHPYPECTNNGFGAYYKNPWNGCISRDQFTGILLAVIKQQEYKAMLRIIIQHACRGFLFCYNTIENGTDPKIAKWQFPDITFMDIWGMELRGFGKLSWLFFPLLCFFDLHLLFGALFDRFFTNKEPDIINFIGRLAVSREYVPTPISWLATKCVNKENFLSRLRELWCGWRDSCDFVPMFENKLNKIL